MAIHKCITTMFPGGSKYDLGCMTVLPWNKVQSEVLVPNAAAMLIQEDLGISYDEAELVRTESTAYGKMMFRDD